MSGGQDMRAIKRCGYCHITPLNSREMICRRCERPRETDALARETHPISRWLSDKTDWIGNMLSGSIQLRNLDTLLSFPKTDLTPAINSMDSEGLDEIGASLTRQNLSCATTASATDNERRDKIEPSTTWPNFSRRTIATSMYNEPGEDFTTEPPSHLLDIPGLFEGNTIPTLTGLDGEPFGRIEASSRKRKLSRATTASFMDRERLERYDQIEASSLNQRSSSATTGSVMDNERRERFGQIDVSSTEQRSPSATTASVMDNEPFGQVEASDVIHFVRQLIRRSTLSFISKGLTWDDETISNVSSVLSSSLDAFADKIGEPGSQLCLRAMAFIKKYRMKLIEDFVKTCSSLSRMKMHDIVDEYCCDEDESAEWRVAENNLFPEIVHAEAWRWLTSRITQNITSFSQQLSIQDVIAYQVKKKIYQSTKTERQRSHHDVTFEVEWDPIAFIQEQCYDQSPQEAIARAITLTGTATEARAVESAQYTKEMWPFSSVFVMRVVQDVVSGRPDLTSYRLDDDTSLRGWMNGSVFVMHVQGTESSVVEVAEQLAWLGAALCTSPYEHGIAVCTPFISSTPRTTSPKIDEEDHDSGKQTQLPTAKACFKLSFSFHPLALDAKDSNGQCWQNLFLNPVLVEGFPITRRPEGVKGLELSLDVMATLLQASHVTLFGATPIIKGFSALVALTEVREGIMLWHLVFNEDKTQRISYNDSRIHRIQDPKDEQISNLQLESSRHILGWCSHAKFLTGAPTASYSITYSGLRRTQPGCVLEKVTIAGGRFITAGVTAAIGKRDKGIFSKARESYLLQLNWVAAQHILLFDVNDRRAWLVDGASALLHLVRSSIHYLQGHKEFRQLCLFEWEKFREAEEQASGKQAAVSVLTNEDNMQLRLFKEKGKEWQEDSIDASGNLAVVTKIKHTFFHFSDKVEQIFHVLEDIVEHQVAAVGEDGLKFMSPRRQLEGFEFTDIVEDRGPLYPKVHNPHDFGKGWLDFVGAIHATILFGNGFGELIQPIDPVGLCPSWVEVPKCKDYLAVSVSIMAELLQRGDKNEVPWRIVDDIYWHSPGKTFEPCQCGHVSSCDRVQVLSHGRFRKKRGKNFSGPPNLEDEGAVIFGHSPLFSPRWGDYGDPSGKVIKTNRGELEDNNDVVTAAPDTTPQSGVSPEIAASLPHRREATVGKNPTTQNDVPARKTLTK